MRPPDLYSADPFERLLRPEFNVPPRTGWNVELYQRDERGPAWRVMTGDQKEGFLLSNRLFEQADHYTSYKFSATLIKKIKENSGRKIVVVDLGGGVLSECMRGILRHPYFQGKVRCINVDLFAQPMTPDALRQEGINPDDLTVLNADFLEAPLEEGSADVIWSYQVLDGASDERFFPMLEKAAALLTPGGEAWLNERWRLGDQGIFGGYIVMPKPRAIQDFLGEPGELQRIANEHDVMISDAYGETTLDNQTHILCSSAAPFIHMGKFRQGQGYPVQTDFRLAWPEIVDVVETNRKRAETILSSVSRSS